MTLTVFVKGSVILGESAVEGSSNSPTSGPSMQESAMVPARSDASTSPSLGASSTTVMFDHWMVDSQSLISMLYASI